MRSSRRTLSYILLVGLAFPSTGTVALEAAPAATVRVEGALPKTGTLGVADLERLEPVTLAWTARGETHRVKGVRVDKVLDHFGFTPGPMGKDVPVAQKVKGLRQVLVATARDGFQAVFSCAEVSEGIGQTVALLVWEVDGKPLSSDVGPFRLVVLTDGMPSRSIRQLERLRVLDAPG